MIEIGTRVRITKTGAVEDPLRPTPAKEDYTPGGHNPGVSLPIEYTLTGVLQSPFKAGISLWVKRHTRNGVPMGGYLQTSIIQLIKRLYPYEGGWEVETSNSVYRIEILEDES